MVLGHTPLTPVVLRTMLRVNHALNLINRVDLAAFVLGNFLDLAFVLRGRHTVNNQVFFINQKHVSNLIKGLI